MTLVWGKSCAAQKTQAFKAFTNLSPYKSDYKDNKNFLKSNKPLIRPLKAFIGPFQALFLKIYNIT